MDSLTNREQFHLFNGGKDNRTQLLVRLVQVVVHNHVSEAKRLRHLQLMLAILQTKLDRLRRIRRTSTETTRELLEGWRLDEDELRLHARLHHLLHALHIDIQDADLVAVRHLQNARERRSIYVSMNVRVLDELSLGNLLLHVFLLREVVVHLQR